MPWSLPEPAGSRALVERDRELVQIERVLDQARKGVGRVVLLYGHSGIGRTALTEMVMRRAAHHGLRLLVGRGSEFERGYAFGLARQLLEPVTHGLSPADLTQALDAAGTSARAALGLGAPDSVAVSDFDKIEGLHRLLVASGRVAPALIVIDDLQWCDRPSLDFLCHLGHRVSSLPIAVVAAWRRGEPQAHAGRLQALAARPSVLFLSLPPLTRGGVAEVLAGQLGREPAAGLIEDVYEQTGGIPFLATELARSIAGRIVAGRTLSSTDQRASVPDAVRREVAARLERHRNTVKQFAFAAAVLGEDCSVEAATAVSLVSIEDGRRAAEALIRAGILRHGPRLSFVAPLLRSAVYDALDPMERSAAHGRVATLLASPESGVDAERIADHVLRSESTHDARFNPLLRQAAGRAARDGMVPAAHAWLVRALREAGDQQAAVATLRELGALELTLGDFDQAAAHLVSALAAVTDLPERVSLTLSCVDAHAGTGDYARATDLLTSTLSSVPASETDATLALQAELAILRHRSPGVPDDAGLESLTPLLGRTSAERTLLAARASLAVLHCTGTASGVRELCERILTAEVRGIDPRALYLAGRAAILADGGDAVEPHLDGSVEPPPSRIASDVELVDAALRCHLLLWRGDLRPAEIAASAVRRALEGLHPSVLRHWIEADVLVALAVCQLEQGRLTAAAQTIRELEAEHGQRECPHPALSSLRLSLSLALERTPDATLMTPRARGLSFAQPRGASAPRCVLPILHAQALDRAECREEALALARSQVVVARRWRGPTLLGQSLLIRGMLEPGPGRVRFLEQAVEALGRTTARLDLAHTQLELGVALREVRARSQARSELARALDLAHHCGAEPLVERARAELLSVGARPRRNAFSGLESLTYSERRVADLAATGMTAREMAGALTVSGKTISAQLCAVYRKLDVHDRKALAAALASSPDPTPPSAGSETRDDERR